MVAVVISVSAVPVVGPVIRVTRIRPVVITIWIIVAVRVISVVAWSEPNAEVDLSIGTWRRSKGQTPRHKCNQEKFLHYLPPND